MSANSIRPQSLIFTLYGDYIYPRSDRIWVGSLIKLLALFGASEQAVRTTVSRMTRRGWLRIERKGRTPYYVFTPAARELIEQGAERIFTNPEAAPPWDGRWHLVTYSIPEDRRQARDRLRRELAWLGYGMLTNTVWLSPRSREAQVQSLAARLGLNSCVHLFIGQLHGALNDAQIAAKCWDLDGMNAEYAAFIARHEAPFRECRQRQASGQPLDDAECFVRRFNLTHEYRRFPFRDPQLPPELTPRDWRGSDAARLFREYHQLLAAPANRFFDSQFK